MEAELKENCPAQLTDYSVCVYVYFMEAELNENCPAHLYPAIGMRAHGSGTVSVCIMDPSNWNSLDDDSAGKHAQV